MRSVTVVVLGDVGRSPRMCYHALSLASHGVNVSLVGYRHSRPHPKLTDHSKIRLVGVPAPAGCLGCLPSALCFALKFLWMATVLSFALFFRVGFPDAILLQNPPGIPTMFICWLAARMKMASLVIDWHNYTSTILEVQMEASQAARGGNSAVKKGEKVEKAPAVSAHGKRAPRTKGRLVSLAERWERFWGRRADRSLCVTRAMRDDLWTRWGVRAVTLYDRPPAWKFEPLSTKGKHQLFARLAAEKLYTSFWHDGRAREMEPEKLDLTRFSRRDPDGTVALLEERPALLVSSTSWTLDEDFGILLAALRRYDAAAKAEPSAPDSEVPRLPNLVAVITGKGPQKAEYMQEIAKLHLDKVEILTPWLEAEDYPKMLRCADLGVCLHTSTSGLDLPMKVVDMFGCELPVLAKRYRCIGELIKEGENGITFDWPSELADWLVKLLRGFPADCQNLQSMRENLQEQSFVSWEENWDATVWPLLKASK